MGNYLAKPDHNQLSEKKFSAANSETNNSIFLRLHCLEISKMHIATCIHWPLFRLKLERNEN
jgi:hypothetical protein